MSGRAPLLEVRGLRTYFHTDEGTVRAVDDVSFAIQPGCTLGLVGESGSGKSVTSLSIMQLLPELVSRIEGGEISFLGRDLVKLPPRDMRALRGRDVAMIFQEPGTALNPVHRVGRQVEEAIRCHHKVSAAEARARTIELFQEVGIPDPEQRVQSYPHEMSGGQKQRVMIAMALSCNPKLLIADEPTTALDVTIQAQILDLLRRLRDERGMSILFITHDLGVIAEIADEIAVMWKGAIVERGDVAQVFSAPAHPYTQGLLACRPRLDSNPRRLQTVADFMNPSEDSQAPSGERTRLLHPSSERPQKSDDSGDQFVPEGTPPLLSVQDLKVHFPIRGGFFGRAKDYVRAVDGVSFDVYPGQTLGIVGESGSGKTTTGRAILRLIEPTEGTILFSGEDISTIKKRERLRNLRRSMQIIFQDPYSSLNPRMTVEAMLTEAMLIHRLGDSSRDRRDRAAKLLEEVGLQAAHLRRYPHEFSGGQRQRIGIARALAVEPEFIVCDESVSALDVSVQAQVLNLLRDLQEERNLTYIFISHDLSVVKYMSDMMAVMKDGKIVEFGPAQAIYAQPEEEYTKQLICSIPNDSIESIRARVASRKQSLAAAEHA